MHEVCTFHVLSVSSHNARSLTRFSLLVKKVSQKMVKGKNVTTMIMVFFLCEINHNRLPDFLSVFLYLINLKKSFIFFLNNNVFFFMLSCLN